MKSETKYLFLGYNNSAMETFFILIYFHCKIIMKKIAYVLIKPRFSWLFGFIYERVNLNMSKVLFPI